MARRRRYISRRRHSGGNGGALMMGLGMLVVFAAVAFMQKGSGILGGTTATTTPAPTSAITPISDTVRLQARDYYAIQFGSYESAASAAEKATEYVDRGAAGYVWKDGTSHRVLAAVYDSLSDAQTIKDRLASQGIEAYIYTIHQDALEMRVAAAEAQRALLSRIFAFLPRATQEIGDASLALDRNTMTVQEAAERMQLLYGEAETLTQEIRSTLYGDEAGVIQLLQALLAQIMTDCADIFSQNSQEELAMAAKIKYNYLDVLWNMDRFIKQVLALSTT